MIDLDGAIAGSSSDSVCERIQVSIVSERQSLCFSDCVNPIAVQVDRTGLAHPIGRVWPPYPNRLIRSYNGVEAPKGRRACAATHQCAAGAHVRIGSDLADCVRFIVATHCSGNNAWIGQYATKPFIKLGVYDWVSQGNYDLTPIF